MGMKRWLQTLGLIAVVGSGDGTSPVKNEGVDMSARIENVDSDVAHAEGDTTEIAQQRAGELKSEAEAREEASEVVEVGFDPKHETEPKDSLGEDRVEAKVEGEPRKVV